MGTYSEGGVVSSMLQNCDFFFFFCWIKPTQFKPRGLLAGVRLGIFVKFCKIEKLSLTSSFCHFAARKECIAANSIQTACVYLFPFVFQSVRWGSREFCETLATCKATAFSSCKYCETVVFKSDRSTLVIALLPFQRV